MIVSNEKVIAGAVTGASVTADVSLVDAKDFAFFVKYSGATFAGSIKLQYSMNGLDWDDLPDSERPIATGGSGLWSADVNGATYRTVRLVCTSTSGAITFEGWVVLKRVSKLG